MTGNIAFLRACHFRRVEESKGVDFNIIKVIRREADGVHRSLNDGSMPAVSVQSCPCMHACESVISLACEHAGTETAHIPPPPPPPPPPSTPLRPPQHTHTHTPPPPPSLFPPSFPLRKRHTT